MEYFSLTYTFSLLLGFLAYLAFFNLGSKENTSLNSTLSCLFSEFLSSEIKISTIFFKSLFKKFLELFKSNKPKGKIKKTTKRNKQSKRQEKRSFQKNRARPVLMPPQGHFSLIPNHLYF